MSILYDISIYQTQVEVKSDLRIAEEFIQNGYQFSPRPEGFSLVFSVDAASNEAARNLKPRENSKTDVRSTQDENGTHYRYTRVLGPVVELANNLNRTESETTKPTDRHGRFEISIREVCVGCTDGTDATI
jgi:hypothetical protein